VDPSKSCDLLDVLNLYSEELLDSTHDYNDSLQLPNVDHIEGKQIFGATEQASHLGPIEDLIADENCLILKTRPQIQFIDTNTNNNYNYNNCDPLSPISCDSDSGYESIPSPTLSAIGSSNVCLEESFTELFPDLC